jgi:hypothetical protein
MEDYISNEVLTTKVHSLIRDKGWKLRNSDLFTHERWTEYLVSLGCEPICDMHFLIENDQNVFVRDEHISFSSNDSQFGWSRVIKMDRQTAMKIATLGMP